MNLFKLFSKKSEKSPLTEDKDKKIFEMLKKKSMHDNCLYCGKGPFTFAMFINSNQDGCFKYYNNIHFICTYCGYVLIFSKYALMRENNE